MGEIINFIKDGLGNILTGRGTSVDRQSHNHWHFTPMIPQQIEAAYRGNWLTRKIVDIPSADMTRSGRDWDGEASDIAKIEAEERRLGYWAKLREALTLGRLGGGAILIGLGDDPSQPLPANIRPGQVQFLSVFSRWQLSIGSMVRDPADPLFGQPEYFQLSGSGRTARIHPSRVVCFKGLPVPALSMAAWEDQFWGDSIVQAVDEAVKQATMASGGFASLIDEAKIDIYRFGGLVAQLSQPDGEAKVTQRVQLTNTGKSIHRAVVLDKDDEWSQRQITWSGMKDVIQTYDARVAGAADIPATRLFGKSPDGQNATGVSDERNYRAMISGKQEMDLRPPMEQIDAVILPSAGVNDAALSWTFSTVSTLTEVEMAEVEAKEAETVVKLVGTGLIPEAAMAKVVVNRLTESQRWPGLADAIVEAEADAGMSDDDGEGDLGVVAVPGVVVDARFMDATPRTVYASRKVVNVGDFKAWAKAQGLPELQDDLHVTIAYSTTPIDWMKIPSDWNETANGNLEIAPGGVRIVEPLGDRGAVLLFTSSRLTWRHEEIIRAGASHGFPDYQPHISLTGEPVDLSSVEPYRGKIILGPEIFEEVRGAE